MSGGPMPGGGALRFTDPKQFYQWLLCIGGPEYVKDHIRMFKRKPIVRVQAPRQVPNEADL